MNALESNPGKTSSMKCSSCRGCWAPGAEGDGGGGGTIEIVARWSCTSSPNTNGGIAAAVTAVAAATGWPAMTSARAPVCSAPRTQVSRGTRFTASSAAMVRTRASRPLSALSRSRTHEGLPTLPRNSDPDSGARLESGGTLRSARGSWKSQGVQRRDGLESVVIAPQSP